MISKKNIIIVIFFLIVSFHLNFFQNFYDIFSKNYDERMIINYGDHDKQGYGFIKKIKNKYKLHQNFIYFNFDMAEPHWLAHLKPKYIYKLNELKNLGSDEIKKYRYIIIINEPFHKIDPFIKEINYKIIIKDTNSYFLSNL